MRKFGGLIALAGGLPRELEGLAMATISDPKTASESKRATALADRGAGSQAPTSTGGYKDRLWFLRFWNGMLLSGLLRMLARNRFHISPSRIGMALMLLFSGTINSVLAMLQAALLGRKIRRTEIKQAPIFIIGHWRSGTTLLHEMLVLDQRHGFPSTYACYAPCHYLLTRRFLPPVLKFMMPNRRPIDNMAAGWDRPQEDEFALCNMGIPSPYLTLMFPNHPPQYQEYLDLDGLTEEALGRWKRALVWFLKCVTVACPKRMVLKSPPHTARIRVLKELFPEAKFVHIVRDPFVLFASTVHLWKRLSRDEGLQVPRGEGLEEQVYQTFLRMYRAYERDRPLLGRAQLCEVRYEDLIADPIGQMRRVYQELELGEFEKVLPELEKFLASQAGYQRNRYEIPPETRAEIARRWGAFIQKYGYSAVADT